MEELTVVDNIDNKVDSVQTIDNSQPNTQPMKKKQVRKPLSEEAKAKKREILAKAREVRTNKFHDKIQVDFDFKKKVENLENLETIIDRKITEKKAKKEPKNKADKQEQKNKMINDLVEAKLTERLKGYKSAKEPESDFKLIQKFF